MVYSSSMPIDFQAPDAVTKEFSKAASAYLKGFLKAAVVDNFLHIFFINVASSDFRKTLNISTSRFRELFFWPHWRLSGNYQELESSVPRSSPKNIFFLFLYFFRGFVYTEYLCRLSDANTQYYAMPGGYAPQDWQSLPCAGEDLDSNPGLLICSQVRYYWATSPPYWSTSPPLEPPLLHIESPLLHIESPLLHKGHLSSLMSHLSSIRATSPPYWVTSPPYWVTSPP